jgi:hypothetical protein
MVAIAVASARGVVQHPWHSGPVPPLAALRHRHERNGWRSDGGRTRGFGASSSWRSLTGSRSSMPRASTRNWSPSHVGQRGEATAAVEAQEATLAARTDMAAHNVADLDRRLAQVAANRCPDFTCPRSRASRFSIRRPSFSALSVPASSQEPIARRDEQNLRLPHLSVSAMRPPQSKQPMRARGLVAIEAIVVARRLASTGGCCLNSLAASSTASRWSLGLDLADPSAWQQPRRWSKS